MSKGETQSGAGAANAGTAHKKKDADSGSAWADLLRSGVKQLIPVLLTGASLIGFVAFAGAVIVWTRLYAIEVPPEQAVKAVPQSELVATGSSLLLIFGFFGVLALVSSYLIDRGARATPGMGRALLVLLAIEGGVAIGMFAGEWDAHAILAIGFFVLMAAVAFAATFRNTFAGYVDELPARAEETLPAVRGPGPLRAADGKSRIERSKLHVIGVLFVCLVALAVVLIAAALPLALELLFLLALICLAVLFGLRVWEVGREILVSWRAERPQGEATNPPGESEEESKSEEEREKAEAKRLRRHRPHRLKITPVGIGLFGALVAFAIVVPCALIGEPLLVVPLGAAMVLGIGVWRVAVLSRLVFMWYGLVVFISVPLFGTFTLMSRNFADPQVQPVAIIRSTDGPDESIQGIYVTEGDDRVYFANVATEGCENEVKDNSGRLLWVPKSEVVAMSIGPLQDVDDAGRTALEMAYALTPNVETPAGDHVSLNSAEQRFEQQAGVAVAVTPDETPAHRAAAGGGKGGSAGKDRPAPEPAERVAGKTSGTSSTDQRLADPGPAVRPDFGSGLALVPETASPGDEVELRLSVPNEHEGVEGFGSRPNGHTLRLGGVPVSILRVGTPQAFDAEYVKTTDGRVLRLDKRGVYRLKDGEPELLEEPGHKGRRYVRLEDSRVESVEGGGLDGHAEFLRIVGEEGGVRLAGAPAVTFVGEAGPVSLEKSLRRQAWEKDRIRFRVPENASTGVVTVECGQLAGSPLLRVSRPPTARIAVHMRAGSRRIRFDSRRSSDDGSIVSRRWTIGGLVRGKGSQIDRALPSRFAPYKIQLTVTDADGETDTAELRLLRIPAAAFRFGDDRPERKLLLSRVRQAVEREAAEELPATIEIDGHADDVGTRKYNLGLSWQRALNVRAALFSAEERITFSSAATRIPVKTRAFGESCPIDLGGGRSRRNRRVEVFVLGFGARVVFPRGCHAGRTARSTW